MGTNLQNLKICVFYCMPYQMLLFLGRHRCLELLLIVVI